MRLLFWRRRPLDDFAQAIQPELRALPTPEATDALRGRIMASRAAGTRTILPEVSESRRRSMRALAAIAVAAAVFLLLVPIGIWGPSRTTDPGGDVSSPGFFGHEAFAQNTTGNDRPNLPPAIPAGSGTLRPMSLQFSRRVRDSTGRLVSDLPIALDVSLDALDGVPAWKVTSMDRDARSDQRHVDVETLYVARADLRLLRRSVHVEPYSRFARINVQQWFRGDSVTGRMTTDGPSIGSGRPIAQRLPVPFSPYITEAFAPAFLMGIPLERHWARSASLLGWAVRTNDVFVPMELRVEGEERVSVPAGRYECWRLSIRFSGHQIAYWVRKSDGLGVRVLAAHQPTNGTREIVLVSEGGKRS